MFPSSLFSLQQPVTVDLTKDTSLLIDISDALSEQEKVKFTVHTKVGVSFSQLVSAHFLPSPRQL